MNLWPWWACCLSFRGLPHPYGRVIYSSPCVAWGSTSRPGHAQRTCPCARPFLECGQEGSLVPPLSCTSDPPTPTHRHTYKMASTSSYKQITKTRIVMDGKQLVLLTGSSLWSRVALRAKRKPKTMQAQRNSDSKTAFLMVKQLPGKAKLTEHVIGSVINQTPTFIFSTCGLRLCTHAYIAITSSLPLKRGSPVCISASMQPKDHMSMERSYGIPNRTSGDR